MRSASFLPHQLSLFKYKCYRANVCKNVTLPCTCTYYTPPRLDVRVDCRFEFPVSVVLYPAQPLQIPSAHKKSETKKSFYFIFIIFPSTSQINYVTHVNCLPKTTQGPNTAALPLTGGSVGWATGCAVGGRGFEPRLDHHSGSKSKCHCRFSWIWKFPRLLKIGRLKFSLCTSQCDITAG